ncbi:MAG: J domain-containing protein [Pseudomonadota bacterium]
MARLDLSRSNAITDLMEPTSKYFDKIRVKKNAKAPNAKLEGPICAWEGCNKPATHKAPMGRDSDGQYVWFCFDHVREYNKNYNYFQGLDKESIARFQKEAATGHRPTWAMGTNRKGDLPPDKSEHRSGADAEKARLRDPYGFRARAAGVRPVRGSSGPRVRKLKPLERKAMETLGLSAAATSDDIKAKYKDLVKRYHPDANGGDRTNEDRLADIIKAYKQLKAANLC